MTITHEHNGFSNGVKPTFFCVLNIITKDNVVINTLAEDFDFKNEIINIHRIDRTIIHVGQWRVKQKETKN